MRLFEPRNDVVKGSWGHVYNELHNLYSSPNDFFLIFILLSIAGVDEDNIKTDLTQIRRQCVESIRLAHDRDQCEYDNGHSNFVKGRKCIAQATHCWVLKTDSATLT
jgi:hypothetical protein